MIISVLLLRLPTAELPMAERPKSKRFIIQFQHASQIITITFSNFRASQFCSALAGPQAEMFLDLIACYFNNTADEDIGACVHAVHDG